MAKYAESLTPEPLTNPYPNTASTADTCTTVARDVVAAKSSKADSPHRERVV